MMTNLLAAADGVRHAGAIFLPGAGAKIAMIDPRDVADVAAVALTETVARELVLTGPAVVTFDDVAAELSAVTGRRIGFVPVPDDAAVGQLVAVGRPGVVRDQPRRRVRPAAPGRPGADPRHRAQRARARAPLARRVRARPRRGLRGLPMTAGLAAPPLRFGDPGYDEGRAAWNLAARQTPAVVVMAESAQDVQAAVRLARAGTAGGRGARDRAP